VTRLYVVSEGLTEINFVRDVITPHLERRWPERITVQAPKLEGNCTYGKVQKLVRAVLGNPGSDVRVTTMIDLYGLPGGFPGRILCDGYEDPWKRVQEMERFFYEDLQDERFIPYLQLHEFEALILTDARCLAKYYPSRKADLDKLAQSIKKQFQSPEEVNRMTSPSRRIKDVVPEYQKVPFGVSAVIDLGIEAIRRECRHFDSWFRKLEALL